MTLITYEGNPMTAFLISYDLKKPGRDYSRLYETIKGLGTWCHYLESVWIVSSSETPSQIWGSLNSHIDENDRLIIIEVRDNVSGWLPQDAWTWITRNVPS